ncbi:MAG: restriction endonuclease [Chloroflexi bacterium]|nr:restriction endonuclease [Chloroflexota bacterium]
MNSPRKDFEQVFKPESKVYQVYLVLKDQQWHCRECEYQHTGITQIAGGSGIQGLQRGTKSRPGMIIESGNHFCVNCDRKTRHDRWQGAFQSSVQGGSMPQSFVKRVLNIFDSRDVVENTRRVANQLTIDHKLPMIRWNDESSARLTAYSEMDDSDIREHFQLLKKSNGSVSHNLLKSRACERCYQTGRRGQPFGIAYFYSGGAKWQPSDKKDPTGCIGCGWYDFALWRDHLNSLIKHSG